MVQRVSVRITVRVFVFVAQLPELVFRCCELRLSCGQVDRDEIQPVTFRRVHRRFDGGFSRIADRGRRQSRVHSRVIRVRSVVEHGVGELVRRDAQTVSDSRIHAQRHILGHTVENHTYHFAVVFF